MEEEDDDDEEYVGVSVMNRGIKISGGFEKSFDFYFRETGNVRKGIEGCGIDL